MTPNAYLLYSIQRKFYQKIAWLISLFTVTKETEAQKAERYPGKLVREPYGLFVVLDNGELEKIDAVRQKGEAPLFVVTDPITITPEWIPSLKEPQVETTLGVLLINLICLYEAFGKKFPYYNKRSFTPKKIEEIMSSIEEQKRVEAIASEKMLAELIKNNDLIRQQTEMQAQLLNRNNETVKITANDIRRATESNGN